MATKFDLRKIMKDAWNSKKCGLIRNFSEALKAAWAKAKQLAKSEVFEFYGKSSQSATYKQYDYLSSFPNVVMSRYTSSAFMKTLNSWDASELIGLAKSGKSIFIKY